MSLDKSIQYGKDHRKPYWKSQRFDMSCRNHNSCGWCEENRKYRAMREAVRLNDEFGEFVCKPIQKVGRRAKLRYE